MWLLAASARNKGFTIGLIVQLIRFLTDRATPWSLTRDRSTRIVYLTRCRDAELSGLQSVYLPMRISACIRLLSNMKPEYRKTPASLTVNFSAYQDIEPSWRTSQHCRHIQEILASADAPFTLTKVIAVALGLLLSGHKYLRAVSFNTH